MCQWRFAKAAEPRPRASAMPSEASAPSRSCCRQAGRQAAERGGQWCARAGPVAARCCFRPWHLIGKDEDARAGELLLREQAGELLAAVAKAPPVSRVHDPDQAVLMKGERQCGYAGCAWRALCAIQSAHTVASK